VYEKRKWTSYAVFRIGALSICTRISSPWWSVSPPLVRVAPIPPARLAGTTWFS
jgi:hypothetical protein